MKNKYFLFILLALVSLACSSQIAPITDTGSVVKAVPPVVPTVQTEKVICLSAEAVRLRMGAGTGYGEMKILSAGDVVTVTGTPVISEDMGIWTPVQIGGLAGFVNSRFLCDKVQ